MKKQVENYLPIVCALYIGREERFFDKFVVSPDNEHLVFLGKDGYMPLVSNKVLLELIYCYITGALM